MNPQTASDLFAKQPEFVRRLIQQPLSGPQDLGKALPDSPHATSVCLPRWQDVVDYEEQQPRVRDRLQAGYPRFVFNPLVAQAMVKAAERLGVQPKRVLLFPNLKTASRAGGAIAAWGGGASGTERLDDHTVALVHDAPEPAKAVWQHAGEGITARHAEAYLQGRHASMPPDAGHADACAIRDRIAGWMGVPEDHVFVYGTGMAAIYALFRAAVQRPEAQGLPTLQFGFPYVDALKLQEKFRFERGGSKSAGAAKQPCRFYPTGDLDELAEDLKTKGRAAALFCEFPSNPLLACPDLPALKKLADRWGFPLFVDDTVACCLNTHLLPFADAITMSLTKYFVGAGDATGGAVVVKPGGGFASMLRQALAATEADVPHPDDLAVLRSRSQDLPQRLQQINRTTRSVVNMLTEHPAVARVYYPSGNEVGWRQRAGCGGLLSFDLVDGARNAPRFYDALDLCKGPNLGTSFSLCGAYTLLAHYHELAFAERCGVSPYLIRLSVGLEPESALIRRLAEALAACSLGV